MARITQRFPDLDLFVDTGDAHHNGRDRDPARGAWTEVIANGCGGVPFYYVPGNHEIDHATTDDPEVRCQRLGSLECRPYYSFDLKNIHFISLPELVRAVYINRESLEWLRLDLAANREKSIILFSHNNITGTTGPFEEGYRGLVNGDALLELFDANPNVLAWMHGHNHNYEVVRRKDMLYVSNGRIGGFDPSRRSDVGPYGLGGIYFEVTAQGLIVRSYSAERACFLDELKIDKTAGALSLATTLDTAAKAAYAFGYGGMRPGQQVPVYHHHAGGDLELYLAPEKEAGLFG